MGYFAPLALCCLTVALAQEKPPHDIKHDTNQPVPTFRSKVNLVLVPVVVRDPHGRPVANLTRDDFQLLDKGKLQTIASFSAVDRGRGGGEGNGNNVTGADNPQRAVAAAPTHNSERAGPGGGSAGPMRHFIYLFDDMNIRFADMANVRAAAVRHFQSNLAAGDRAAIYTMSGNPRSEFTGDREKLQDTVSKLRWRPSFGSGMQCPDINYYIADLIIGKGDGEALAALTDHTQECAHVRPEVAKQIAVAAANRELMTGAVDTEAPLMTIRRAIRRLSGMPGQRVIVLASPGFFAQTPEAIKATAEVLDLAAKSDVIINGLSVRGVILAEEEEDVTRRAGSPRRAPPVASSPGQSWIRYRRESAHADGDVMKDLAEGTGGIFFHGNNDLGLGLDRVAAAPEFSYALGFTPAGLKADGSFHSLKVRLPNARGVNVEARRGYYALEPDSKDSATAAEIEDAVFSRDEIAGIPVVLQTGYSKPVNGDAAKVLLLAKIDHAIGQSGESLRAVAALFDPEGGYVTGAAKTVSQKLPDETRDPVLTLNWEFPNIKPGRYLVRLVIREAGGKGMTAMNRALVIP